MIRQREGKKKNKKQWTDGRMSYTRKIGIRIVLNYYCCCFVVGLEAFSFDYEVKWPVSLILSKKVSF